MANQFIGSGYIFPIILNENGRPDSVDDIRLIEASLKTIFTWPKYNRFFVENFGSRINELLEEPNDGIARSLLVTFIKEAVDEYEKRIKVRSVDIVNVTYISVDIRVRYYIRNSKIEETFIFPYYKELN